MQPQETMHAGSLSHGRIEARRVRQAEPRAWGEKADIMEQACSSALASSEGDARSGRSQAARPHTMLARSWALHCIIRCSARSSRKGMRKGA